MLRSSVRPLAAALLIVPGTLVATAMSASAAPAESCEEHEYSVVGVEKDGAGNLQYGIHGVRADVYAGTALYCNRVSSLAILGDRDSANDRVIMEFGWVLGWSNCNDTYYSSPRLFIWWSGIGDGNAIKCRVLADGGSADTFHTMRVGDIDGDTVWNAYYDTNLVPNSEVNTNFSSGSAADNAERTNAKDSAYAEFTTLAEYHAAWSAWDNVRPNYDNDPDFHFVRIAGDHSQVVHD